MSRMMMRMTLVTHSEKVCFKCGGLKPIDEFYSHPKTADRHLNKCKQCTKADSSNHRLENVVSVREYDRQRGGRKPVGYDRDYREQFPKRAVAVTAVNNAVRDGRLKQLPCFVCGEKAQAHHPDYDDPLSVIWLCSCHHKQAHALVREVHF